VIVDHADGLHEGVTDGGTHEAEAAGFQVLAQRIRFRGACRKLARRRPMVLLRAAAYELPHVTVERAEFPLHGEKRGRVGNCGRDLQPVAHNPSVAQKRPHFTLVVARDLRRIEPIERPPVILALVENRLPAQTRLRTFEDQELEEHAVAVHRLAPLVIVVLDHQRLLRPMAAALLFFGFHSHTKITGAQLKSLCGKSKFMASAAEQVAEKGFQPFPQGLKPVASQAPIVGAKAPTP